jgi:hypothetical protein
MWTPIKDSGRHTYGRDGDHLITPFQCDLCIFRNLMNHNPLPNDTLLLACIRQVNLDALWGREPSTVDSTKRSVNQLLNLWQQLNVTPTLPIIGPHPVADTFGYAVAIAMVLKSRDKGRYAAHQQYETIRKLRAGYTNTYMSSVAGTQDLHTVGGDTLKYSLSKCPTHSLWFERFTKGCLSRMGQEIRQDMAISLPVMHALLHNLEQDWLAATSPAAQRFLASIGAFVCIAFCGSFRGPEVFLTDFAGLRKYLLAPPDSNLPPHVIVPLLGRFKSEIGARYHLTPLAATTASGISVHRWVSRLVSTLTEANYYNGPAFCDSQGSFASSQDYETEILDRLQAVQSEHPSLIPMDVLVHDSYGISRSF